MLGSGEEPDPLIMKKVEHRGKIPYHKSTTNHNKGKISMLNKDYTAKLLNLEDAIITNVENISGEVHIFLELPRTKHPCPACGALTDRVHDYRMQTVKDVPFGRKTLLHLRKRRYRCMCGKRFFEKNFFLPRYHRVTSRLVAAIIGAFHELVPASEIGARYNGSGATAARYFKYVAFKPTQLPEVLSIDEFKGNSGGEKYNSIIVDAEKHKVVDILPNRFENDLIKYFSQFPSKTSVKYFVCDMNPHFRAVSKTCFPGAAIVADRYHVIRQVYWAMERVRKKEQKKPSARFRKYFKRSRCLLMKPMAKLSNEEMERLALMFEIAPRLADAYRLKNEFLDVIRAKSSAAGKPKLIDWLRSAETMGLPEFSDCIKAYRNWFREILNSMDVPWSNGFIEGCNNKTKVLKRVCFGMRNFHNFRRRILFCHT